MQPIIIPFTPNNLGRVEFEADIITGDRLSLRTISFKLDSGSDFTTVSCIDLEMLGYEPEYLESCPYHDEKASSASEKAALPLQYIENVSIKFKDRELQGCRVFFARGTHLSSLFGSDLLKYFNREINYDAGELRLLDLKSSPSLSPGEKPIQIYSLES
jgi:hypothetical protein